MDRDTDANANANTDTAVPLCTKQTTRTTRVKPRRRVRFEAGASLSAATASSVPAATIGLCVFLLGVCICICICASPAAAWTVSPRSSPNPVRVRPPLFGDGEGFRRSRTRRQGNQNRAGVSMATTETAATARAKAKAEETVGSGESPEPPDDASNGSHRKRQKTMHSSDDREDPEPEASSSSSSSGDSLLTPIPPDVLTTTLSDKTDGSPLELPDELAYPFWYDPHPIAKWAADRLREELPPWNGNRSDKQPDSGDTNDNVSDNSTATTIAPGKMYGVLVVRLDGPRAGGDGGDDGGGDETNRRNDKPDEMGEQNDIPRLGYLKAYSGTMTRPQYGGAATPAIDEGAFCPLVYDRFGVEADNHNDDGGDESFCYEREEEILNGYTRELERLEACPERRDRERRWRETEESLRNQLAAAKKEQKNQKRLRKERRTKLRKRLLEDLRREAEDGRSDRQQQQQQQQQQQLLATVRGMSEKESHKHFLERSDEYRSLEDQLVRESASDQRGFRTLRATLEKEIETVASSLAASASELETLRRKRREGSMRLSDRLFRSYRFLNAGGDTATLPEIFANTPLGVPPGGAGDCAAIKLFQSAFARGYAPVALAEFWWGPSPHARSGGASGENDNENETERETESGVARTHGNYYPCCRGKCEPILTRHMLLGTPVESDPLTEGAVGWSGDKNKNKNKSKQQQTQAQKLESLRIVYEDEWMIVVDKPHDVLSVPGRTVSTSVQTRLREDHPDALPVHRLDYSTSGLLLVAKDSETRRKLQAQFVARTVQKRYTALLDGEWPERRDPRGVVDLPLAGDYVNRPMQKVERGPGGKPAVTRYEVVVNDNDNENKNKNSEPGDQTERRRPRTRVRFYPVTGRTHQLRVHASHPEGLGMAIVGDDIYGTRDERLCLHAGILRFTHPVTGRPVELEAPDPF